MSYSLFKTEIGALTGMQHVSRLQFAQVVGKAYNGLVERHFETLTGSGKVVAPIARLPALIQGIYSITESNLAQSNDVNFFSQIAPFIYTYWAGQVMMGPLGIATITSTGIFQGPIVPQNFNIQIWLNVFVGVVAVHILSLIGTYTNYVSGITSPWSGGLLLTTP